MPIVTTPKRILTVRLVFLEAASCDRRPMARGRRATKKANWDKGEPAKLKLGFRIEKGRVKLRLGPIVI